MITCTKELSVEAGHRLVNHESKCYNAHGHNYIFAVTVTAKELDAVGRIIDFGDIKKIVGAWLDLHWDHGFIYQRGDTIGDFLTAQGLKTYAMDNAPTAENLAYLLFEQATKILPPGMTVVSVVCHETATCSARYAP